MSNAATPPVSAAELRRRVRAVEALKAKTREMAVATVLSTRGGAEKAALAKEDADLAAREAAAAALRLFDNDAELVAELLGISAEELERDAKPVTAARAKEVIEELRARADRTRTRRTRTSRTEGAAAPAVPPAAASANDGMVDAA
ncbi:hypothetical protein EST92_29055 [Streptomyces sp. TM32]|uniref:hypothetical protein n=1 Tax=Streptomyces sp. TM32 TaxID=1652669 RepID=UPI0010106266|nr:hypothetical protein [Streptomyces sp. TM32]RXS66150.1 hypothetical protein EST92_29055 [Streptomyces sp. TM32]